MTKRLTTSTDCHVDDGFYSSCVLIDRKEALVHMNMTRECKADVVLVEEVLHGLLRAECFLVIMLACVCIVSKRRKVYYFV